MTDLTLTGGGFVGDIAQRPGLNAKWATATNAVNQTTNGGSLISSGIGVTITPQSTARVLLEAWVAGQADTVGTICKVAICRDVNGSGIPASGTLITVGNGTPVSYVLMVTGVVNTTVWAALSYFEGPNIKVVVGVPVSYFLAFSAGGVAGTASLVVNNVGAYPSIAVHEI